LSRAYSALHSFPTRRSSDLHRSLALHLQLHFEIRRLTALPNQINGSRRLLAGGFHHNRAVLHLPVSEIAIPALQRGAVPHRCPTDRKSTRLNSSHDQTSYAV